MSTTRSTDRAAHTTLATGTVLRWHRRTHTECAGDACGLAHATKQELLDAMDEIASRNYDDGKDAARGER